MPLNILAQEHGCRVVAISDVSGGLAITLKEEFCNRTLNEYVTHNPGSLLDGYARTVGGESDLTSLLGMTSRIPPPWRIRLQLTPSSVSACCVKANGPTTFSRCIAPAAVPDILANAGGVTFLPGKGPDSCGFSCEANEAHPD